ncbi:MAG: sulfate adenylyltransferase, partial [Blastocatellia bacterium]|nr:sulfate adenylyltransferase [Blastocatellia bacterium]
METIKPHGGQLINREVVGEERQDLISRAKDMPQIVLNAREVSDL